MSYLVLARKYRPATFSEVVGQEHVTRTLANAFSADRVHHAFLFCGPRGCGKTTVARIVGKALNCEQRSNSAEPCGTCSACTSIGNGSAIDYQEMDGASNRGIDAIRELTEAVRYQPAMLRKKVYVIDEVHMLTTEAFNALLKTLEEPPPHVTFVLATTEPHKLPNTILSRCQRYDFKLVPASRLAAHLSSVFVREKLAIEPGAVSLLVRESGGSVRDALSLCDQLISFVGNTAITERHVAEVLGVADRSLTRTLVRALAAGEAGEALGAVESAIERGVDEVQLARAIVRYLRDLSVLQVAPNRPELIDAADEERVELLNEAQTLDRSRVGQMFERMLRCCDELGKTLQPRLVLDCALIDVATVEPLLPLGDLIERLAELEGRLIRGGARPSASTGARAPMPARPNPLAEQYAGGAAPPTKPSMTGLLDAALEEDRPRKRAPEFATGTTPGQRTPAAPPTPVSSPAPVKPEPPRDNRSSGPAPQAKGSRAEAPRGPTPTPTPTKGKKQELAVGTGTGNDAEVATAVAAARVAKQAADAARMAAADTRGMDAPHPADTMNGHASAIAETKRGPVPEARPSDDSRAVPSETKRGIDGRVANDDSQRIPSAISSSTSAATASISPSGPVPAAPAVASGSGPNEQLTAAPADVLRAWNTVLGELETRRKFTLLGPFQHARVMKWGADLIELGFPVDVHSMGEMASEQKQIDELRSIIRELGAELAQVKVIVRMLDANESAQGGTRSVLEDTRAKSLVERSKREAEAREHPITKHVLQTFGGQIKEIKTDV